MAPLLAGEPTAVVPFHGVHQAGITTGVQAQLHLASFDLTTTDRSAPAPPGSRSRRRTTLARLSATALPSSR